MHEVTAFTGSADTPSSKLTLTAATDVVGVLKHLHIAEMRLCCPYKFLSLYFQRRDDISELKQRFRMGLRHDFTCRKLEAMCKGREPVRRFSLTRALARKGMRAKTEMSPVSWFWLRSRFCSTTTHGLLAD